MVVSLTRLNDRGRQILPRTADSGWAAPRPSAEAGTSNIRLGLADALYDYGQLEEALRLYEQLSAEAPDNTSRVQRVAVTVANLGDRDRALELSDAVDAMDIRFGRGSQTLRQARIAAAPREEAVAVELLRTAFSQGANYSVGLHREPWFFALRSYPPFQELMRPRE